MPSPLMTRAAVSALAAGIFAAVVGLAFVDLGMGSADAAAPAVEAPAADCDARVARAETSIAVTLVSLGSVQSASAPARCEAYRNHLATLTDAGRAYGACLTGFQRTEMVAQFDLAARDWQGVIADVCAKN